MSDEELCGWLRSMLPRSGFAPTENWAPHKAADLLEKQAARIEELTEKNIAQADEMDGAWNTLEKQAQLIRNLRETGDRLAGYSGHDDDCGIHDPTPSVCDCGYTTIIHAWKELGE